MFCIEQRLHTLLLMNSTFYLYLCFQNVHGLTGLELGAGERQVRISTVTLGFEGLLVNRESVSPQIIFTFLFYNPDSKRFICYPEHCIKSHNYKPFQIYYLMGVIVMQKMYISLKERPTSTAVPETGSVVLGVKTVKNYSIQFGR